MLTYIAMEVFFSLVLKHIVDNEKTEERVKRSYHETWKKRMREKSKDVQPGNIEEAQEKEEERHKNGNNTKPILMKKRPAVRFLFLG